MKLTDFDFILPAELIAQTPMTKRDEANLLVAQPNKQLVQTKFYNIIDYLHPNDLVVFNDSRVINAKLTLNKAGRKIELYLNRQIKHNYWLGFARPARKLNEGDQFDFVGNKIIISKKLAQGEIDIKFDLKDISVFQFLEKYGEIPLPPYIKRAENLSNDDNDRYQTIYGNKLGAVAAPTAGLHFTNDLLASIRAQNIEIVFVTLHVGAGTFLPVKTDDIDQHKMHSEYYHITEEAAHIINEAKSANRRIIAVGTTSLRVLESAEVNGQVTAGNFETAIFIRPGFKFQMVDMLITNFHLPKTTLYMLVCAFAGYQQMRDIYQYAIENKMRFFSYGDASLLYLLEQQG